MAKIKRFLLKFRYLISNVDNILASKIKEIEMTNNALESTDYITTDEKYLDSELIVSLTTYNKRIHDVHLVVESISRQTIKPNRIILWLDNNEFDLESLPIILRRQIDRGLEIKFCENYRSYKKLVPTLIEYTDETIITIDDDIIYPHDMIEGLVNTYKKHLGCIVAHRVHEITVDNKGNPKLYNDWNHEVSESNPSHLNVAIGVGGILYPSNSLSIRCIESDLFYKLAPNADDIWFKAMALIKSSKVVKVDDQRSFRDRFLTIESGQDIALANNNLVCGENDNQIGNVFKEFEIKIYKDGSVDIGK